MKTVSKILKAIWNFINSKFFGYVVAIVLVIFLATMCQRNRDLREDLERSEQNNSALTDTLKREKLKTGELQFTIDGFIASEKELKKLNKDLYDELQKQKGKVISLNKIVILLQQDTTDLRKYIAHLEDLLEEPIKLNDSTYLVPWTLNYIYDKDTTNYDLFKGQTKIRLTWAKNRFLLTPDNEPAIFSRSSFELGDVDVKHLGTEMTSRKTQIELVWGQKWEKGRLRVFANSKYPGFSVTNMEGILLDVPKRPHWFTGFSVNLGIMPTYDFIQQKPTIVVGPSFGYTIYQW
ncbi:MAG: hypothetical protein GYA51_14070 [Candidatus Methanofastidiosa archaeon]|jgi:hypothetical protein|nr:hypothetical protein [Candidatus Methanofastidiosa archaeon]